MIKINPGGGSADPFLRLKGPIAEAFNTSEMTYDTWRTARPRDAEPSIEGVRELSAEEAANPPETRRNGSGAAPIPVTGLLKVRHHEIARLMSSGVLDVQISETLDVSTQHLRLLRRSPAFQSLLAAYLGARDEAYKDVQARIAATANLALEHVSDEIMEGKISGETLRKTTVDLLDRSGHSVVHKSVAVVGLSQKDLADLKELGRAQAARVVDVTLEQISETSQGIDRGPEGQHDPLLLEGPSGEEGSRAGLREESRGGVPTALPEIENTPEPVDSL